MIGPRFDAAAHARTMRADGFWVDKTYDEFLQKAIAAAERPGERERGAVSAGRGGAAAFARVPVSDEIVNLFTRFHVASASSLVYIVR